MKKIALSFSFLLLFISDLYSNIPSEFSIKHAASSITAFYLEAQNSFFAKVVKEGSSDTVFRYKNNNDQLLATGIVASSSSGPIVEVFNENQDYLGSIKLEVFKILPSKYKLHNEKGELIAVAEMNWLGSRFTLINPKNSFHDYASYSRPYFMLFNDYWYVKIADKHAIDARLMIMLGVFQAYLNTKNNELGRGSVHIVNEELSKRPCAHQAIKINLL